MKMVSTLLLKRFKQNTYTVTDIIAIIAYLSLALLILFTDASVAEKLITLIGLMIIVLQIDSRIIFLIAIVGLINIPILNIIKKENLAENFAVYVFYFLVIGVIASMLENQASREAMLPNRDFEPIAKIKQSNILNSQAKQSKEAQPAVKPSPVQETIYKAVAVNNLNKPNKPNKSKTKARIIQ